MESDNPTMPKIIKTKCYNKMLNKEEHKSDTDSGRSSAHGDKDLIGPIIKEIPAKPIGKLKVSRCTEEKLKILTQSHVDVRKFNAAGMPFNGENVNGGNIAEPTFGQGRLQVIRRKDAILKRRHMNRRNTIDVNLFDMKKAAESANFGENLKMNYNASKSTNCLDKLGGPHSSEFANRIDQLNLNGSSMPGKSFAHLYCHKTLKNSYLHCSLKQISVKKKKNPRYLNYV